MDELPQLVFDKQMLLPGGLFIMEHTHRNDYQMHPSFLRMKNYGSTVFTFFKRPTI